VSNRVRRRQAWRQALGLLLVSGALAGACIVAERRPAGPEEVRIHVAALRSQAAELDNLQTLERQHCVTPAFARRHARQLEQAVARERSGLAALHIEQPRLEALRVQAHRIAGELATALRAAQQRGAPSAPALARELQGLEEALPTS